MTVVIQSTAGIGKTKSNRLSPAAHFDFSVAAIFTMMENSDRRNSLFVPLCLKKSFAARDILNGQIIPESDDYDPEEYYDQGMF